jgi:hypothetical protein
VRLLNAKAACHVEESAHSTHSPKKPVPMWPLSLGVAAAISWRLPGGRVVPDR